MAAAILQNANIKGFIEGRIYRGDLKQICVPGLNCYSCPGALGACPIGSLQSIIMNAKYVVSFYVMGLIALFGVIFGRWICGFLCPFGWVQELLYKVPLKKAAERRVFRRLSYCKYLILALFVVGIPLYMTLAGKISFPAFCEWICPAGTLEAGVPLVLMNKPLQNAVGLLFVWKISVLAAILYGAIKLFRPFCRFFCPLGAIYSLFNKLSIVTLAVDEGKCTACGACAAHCKMRAPTPQHRECIRCGECARACPQEAIRWRIGKKDCGAVRKGTNHSSRSSSVK